MDKNVKSQNELVVLENSNWTYYDWMYVVTKIIVFVLIDLTKYLANLATKWHLCFD
jgi:hypothetical protein